MEERERDEKCEAKKHFLFVLRLVLRGKEYINIFSLMSEDWWVR